MGRTEIAIAVGICSLVALVVWASLEEEKDWRAFVEANNCKVIRETASKTAFTSGYTGDGKYITGTTTIPRSKTWRCKNEVEYTR